MDIINSFEIENEVFYFYDITKVINTSQKLKRLPIVLKILLESNLRCSKDAIEFNKIVNIFSNRMNSKINFYPSRIIMQDFTGIPALVDLASMRDTVKEQGGDINNINPQIMVDLVIDHSLSVHMNNKKDNYTFNVEKENELNKERYTFAKWAQGAFSNLRVVPPGSGICHQVNLEYLSTILHLEKKDDKFFLYPETIVGTDVHTTMINSLGVLAWSVEGIKAESTMLGNTISLNLPKVVGVNIQGELKEGITSSDIVTDLIDELKKHNLEGKLVEFYGEGLKYLTLEDRSAISNLAPEYKARSSFFSIDDKTIKYFNKTRDNEDYGNLIKTYLEKQGLYNQNETLDFDELIEFDLSNLTPIIKGPSKSQNITDISNLKKLPILNRSINLKDADIVLAVITSCTSSSNPYLLIHAALIAKKALSLGLKVNKNIKTSFIPASLVEKEYLEKLDLLKPLEEVGFNIIGYGCTTVYKNSADLDSRIQEEIKNANLSVCSVTSGNKNFEGKINPLVKSNYLMSPSLVVIYSLIGKMKFDLYRDVIDVVDEKDIYLSDLWPSNQEIGEYLQELDFSLYKDIYKDIFKGNEYWQKLIVEKSNTYNWDNNSTYIQKSKFFDDIKVEKIALENAGIMALLGDNISTDHISPIGQISLYSTTAKYLESKGVKSFEYNSFGSRRGNSEVMVRGTFDNVSLQNQMVSKEGAYTKDFLTGEIISFFDKSQRFKDLNRDLVIFAGKNYGRGIPRDWAAKGTKLLGVKAVIANSFDETHKFSLICLGILPLEFIDDDIHSLKLKGSETITIKPVEIKTDLKVSVIIHKKDSDIEIELNCRLDTNDEVEYYKNGGVLPFLLKSLT